MVEILVHVAGRATRKDDELYRSLADAYLDFEPHHEDQNDAFAPIQPLSETNSQHESGRQSKRASNHIISPMASKKTYGSLPSHLLLDASGRGGASSVDSYALESLDDSLIGTSRLLQLEEIQANWRRQKEPQSSPSYDTRSDEAVFIEDTQLAAEAVQSQLPDDISMSSEHTSGDEPETMTVDKAIIAIQPPLSAEVKILTDNHESTLPNAHQMEPVPCTSPIPQILRLSTVSGSESEKEGVKDWLHGVNFSHLPFEVLPPAPKITTCRVNTLPSQMTSYLRAIKQQNPYQFKPSRRLRALNADERGYWLVETNDWPKKTQYDFWSSLSAHIRCGRFGWGVFLHREAPHLAQSTTQSARGIGQVRFYCWGEIVEEIWLALWLSSCGKLSRSGSRWVDAEDVVIIQVP